MDEFIKIIEHIMERVNRDKYEHEICLEAQINILREILGEAERNRQRLENEDKNNIYFDPQG